MEVETELGAGKTAIGSVEVEAGGGRGSGREGAATLSLTAIAPPWWKRAASATIVMLASLSYAIRIITETLHITSSINTSVDLDSTVTKTITDNSSITKIISDNSTI
jgi:hypothetical protein